jgi:hypothetical protein
MPLFEGVQVPLPSLRDRRAFDRKTTLSHETEFPR